MVTFVVETYLSGHAEHEPDRTVARATAAIAELNDAGEPIRYVRSIFIPEDETLLLLVEAASAEVVRTAIARAGLEPDRIVGARTEARSGSASA